MKNVKKNNSEWLNNIKDTRKHYYTEKLGWPKPNPPYTPYETFLIFML